MRKAEKNRVKFIMHNHENYPNRSFYERALHFILVVMIVVCIMILIGAFFMILDSHRKIYELSAEISEHLEKTDGITSLIMMAGKSFLDRLEAYGKSLMEASTISFLIAVLSAGVIAYAVSLINRAQKEINNMKMRIDQLSSEAQRNVHAAGEKVEELEATTKAVKESADRFFDSIVIDWDISTCLSKAQQLSRRLRRVSDKKTFDSLVPDVRDHLHYVYRDLEYAKEQSVKLNPPLCQDFRNEVLDIKMDLESVHDRYRDKVTDLIKRCDKITKVLTELYPDSEQ